MKDSAFRRDAVEDAVTELGGLDIVVNNAAVMYQHEGLEEISDEELEDFFRTNVLGYAETTGANHTFTKSMAQSLIGRGIRVNCVSPGPVWTPLNASSRTPEQMAGYGETTDPVPLGRPAQPEEIAPAFVFFASNVDSSYVNGEILALYGSEVLAR